VAVVGHVRFFPELITSGNGEPASIETACISHHLAEDDFLNLLAAAVAREEGLAQIVHRGGQAADHPALLSMPETAYLKCVVLTV
jgi:23S rRNA (cytosine1962-C5)-methyltransferase